MIIRAANVNLWFTSKQYLAKNYSQCDVWYSWSLCPPCDLFAFWAMFEKNLKVLKPWKRVYGGLSMCTCLIPRFQEAIYYCFLSTVGFKALCTIAMGAWMGMLHGGHEHCI